MTTTPERLPSVAIPTGHVLTENVAGILKINDAQHLLIPDQPPQSPEGWERWYLWVTKKAIKADHLGSPHRTQHAAR